MKKQSIQCHHGIKKSGECKKKPADIPVDCKWCPSCETIKNRSTFCPSATRGDGLQYSCRACYTKNRTKKKTLNKLKNGN